MTDFAVHALDGGEWVLDSIFDDPELAIFEACTLKAQGRYEDLRVVEMGKGADGDAVAQTLFLTSESSPDTEDIIRRLQKLRGRPRALPPGVEWSDPDVTIG